MTRTEVATVLYKCAIKLSNSRDKKRNLIKLPQIIASLADDITNRLYKPSAFQVFIVTDPKLREIFAPAFRDRLAQQWLISLIEPFINSRFIDDAYSNRKGKGTHAAIERLQSFMRKNNTNYYCQIDIRSFFPSIDRSVLLSVWKKWFVRLNYDAETLAQINYIAMTIITHSPLLPPPLISGRSDLLGSIPPHKSLFHTPEGKGLPIGSLSSQFFSNLYLNELDQYVKHILRVKHYIRYVDDMVILGNDLEKLYEQKNKIDLFLHKQLRLALHPDKTVIQRVSKGIDFLGAIVFPHHRYVRRRNIRAFRVRVDFFNSILNNNTNVSKNKPNGGAWGALAANREWKNIHPEYLRRKMLSTINSYFGLFCHSRSYRLRVGLKNNIGIIGEKLVVADTNLSHFCCWSR